MEFKITSSNKPKLAMTLVEMMVATGVGSIVLLVLGSLTIFSARSFSALVNYTDLNQDSRMALDLMSREIRQSRGLVARTPTSLTFKTLNGNVTYSYNQTNKTVTLQTTNGTKAILTDCTSWTNRMFQRTPQKGNFDFYETEDPAFCKMIQLNWVNAVRNSPKTTNSESVQSMTVVIRKRPD